MIVLKYLSEWIGDVWGFNQIELDLEDGDLG